MKNTRQPIQKETSFGILLFNSGLPANRQRLLLCHRHPHRWPNTARAAYPTGRSPSARARQAGTRICKDEVVLRDSPVLARLVKRSPNELLCGTSANLIYTLPALTAAQGLTPLSLYSSHLLSFKVNDMGSYFQMREGQCNSRMPLSECAASK